jgi:hypothetical protein
MDPWLDQFETRIRDRAAQHDTITLLGIDLRLKPSVAPQVATRYWDAQRRLTEFYVARDDAQKTGNPPPDQPADLYDEPLLTLIEETARACITADSVAGWNELRAADRDIPLNWRDLLELMPYLLARASHHPTDGPSDSSDGPSKNGATSKAGSSSRAAEART